MLKTQVKITTKTQLLGVVKMHSIQVEGVVLATKIQLGVVEKLIIITLEAVKLLVLGVLLTMVMARSKELEVIICVGFDTFLYAIMIIGNSGVGNFGNNGNFGGAGGTTSLQGSGFVQGNAAGALVLKPLL